MSLVSVIVPTTIAGETIQAAIQACKADFRGLGADRLWTTAPPTTRPPDRGLGSPSSLSGRRTRV